MHHFKERMLNETEYQMENCGVPNGLKGEHAHPHEEGEVQAGRKNAPHTMGRAARVFHVTLSWDAMR